MVHACRHVRPVLIRTTMGVSRSPTLQLALAACYAALPVLCTHAVGTVPPRPRVAAAGTPAALIKLGGAALCLDGSPATYYISKGSNASAFLFHFQGGGWCQTLEECAQRAKTQVSISTRILG